MTTTATARASRMGLVGNRLVLVGAVLYLLEWVAIIAGNIGVPLGATTSAAKVAAAYQGHADALGWAAGWFSVVLLGRVLVMAGLRAALAGVREASRLLEVAVAAMAVSVGLEIVTYAVAAGGSWELAHNGSLGVTRALDAVSFELNTMIYGPLGVSLVCAGLAMWRAALFPRVLVVLALAAGVLSVLIGLFFAAPKYTGVAGALSAAALLMWVWMLWTGVLVWRAREPRRS